MSRIRSIHPGLWTDDAFMALSAHARLLIIGIWTEAYDDGVFDWKPLTLKARIFPVDNVDVTALLDELLSGNIVRREEVGGRQVGLVRNFRDFQRPKTPNSSGVMRDDWRIYVGLEPVVSEAMENHFGNASEKSPQMEDGGGRREDGNTSPPPVPEPEGARVEFSDVWEAYPQNPTSSESKALKAWDRVKPWDRGAVLDAAIRYARWFGQDCEARDRTVDAGLSYVPHLAKWLDSGEWREVGKLPVKGEGDPSLTSVHRDSDDFRALERLRGKPIVVFGDQGLVTVAKAELERAREMH